METYYFYFEDELKWQTKADSFRHAMNQAFSKFGRDSINWECVQ